LGACSDDTSGSEADGGTGGSSGGANASTTGSGTNGTGTTGSGTNAGTNGGNVTGGQDGDAGIKCGGLRAIVRDMKDDHPDFEKFDGQNAYLGLVESQLGSDNKPVYAHAGPTGPTAGPGPFAQWYNDTADVNMPVSIAIEFEEVSPGQFVFDDQDFFPLDGMGFGNQGRDHNFHFTTEIHTKFSYKGGESFEFIGDDDLWLFINGKLAIDLGGLHPPLSSVIDLDDKATELGITPGNTYNMDIFHAERHTVQSTFRIETSIECFQDPMVE
jgi:fibro-slime domain-containing protein